LTEAKFRLHLSASAVGMVSIHANLTGLSTHREN